MPNRPKARLVLPASAVLLLAAAAGPLLMPAWAAAGGAGAAGDREQAAVLTGVVRDVNGAVQMGALVQVLGQGSRTVATAFTDMHGRYTIANLAAGRYVVRASAALFVPASKSGLELRRGTSSVVNLTLAALFDPASWLPAERRRMDEAADDWKWTLRSSASRPILRDVAEDEDEKALPEGQAAAVRVHARDAVAGGDGYLNSGVRNTVTITRDGAAGSESLQATLAPDAAGGSARVAAGVERHDRFGGATRTVISYETHPTRSASAGQSAFVENAIQVYTMTSAERFTLGDRVEVEAGARAEAVRTTVYALATHPFVHISVHPTGTWRLEYRLATDREVQDFADVSGTVERVSPIPTAVVRDGRLALEHGRHQQLSATHKTKYASVAVAVYHDAMSDVAISGAGLTSTEGQASLPTGATPLVVDPATGQFRTLAGGYQTTGARVSFSAPVKHSVWISAEYSTGAAVASSTASSASAQQALNGLSARNAQAAALAVEGRVIGSGTRVRASYRWQPGKTVTAVDPFSDFASQAYLGLLVEEPIRLGTLLPRGLNATVDITNLLAQGYRPFLSADGQTLYFAQTPRMIQAGLSFTF